MRLVSRRLHGSDWRWGDQMTARMALAPKFLQMFGPLRVIRGDRQSGLIPLRME